MLNSTPKSKTTNYLARKLASCDKHKQKISLKSDSQTRKQTKNAQLKLSAVIPYKPQIKSLVKKLFCREADLQNPVKDALSHIRRLFTLNDYRVAFDQQIKVDTHFQNSNYQILGKQYLVFSNNGADFGNEPTQQLAMSALNSFEKNLKSESNYRQMHSLSRKLCEFALTLSLNTELFGKSCKHVHNERVFFRLLLWNSLIKLAKRIDEHEKSILMKAFRK